MPGGAAEKKEHFHVPQTVGLIQKKFGFLLDKLRFKPICSCTKFLYTGSWLQGKYEWQWDGVTQTLVRQRAVVLLVRVGTGAVHLAQAGRLKAGPWGTALTWRCVGLGM